MLGRAASSGCRTVHGGAPRSPNRFPGSTRWGQPGQGAVERGLRAFQEVEKQCEITLRPDQFSPNPSCDSRWAGRRVVLAKFPGLSLPSFSLVSSSTRSVSKPPICARHCLGHGGV